MYLVGTVSIGLVGVFKESELGVLVIGIGTRVGKGFEPFDKGLEDGYDDLIGVGVGKNGFVTLSEVTSWSRDSPASWRAYVWNTGGGGG